MGATKSTAETSGFALGKKSAHGFTRTRSRQKCDQQFDGDIIARMPLPARTACCVLAALTLSGVLPVAMGALLAVCGPLGVAGCLAADAALAVWAVRSW